MADKSYNEIRGTEDNWALDDRNGLPYSGKSIREFQQKKNRQVDENTARKHGATFFDQSTMKQYKFASEEAKEAWIESGDPSLIIGEDDFNFSSEIEQLKITSAQPTTLWFTTTAQKAEITVGFVSRKKGITDTEWEEVENDVVRFSVRVDAGNKNNWVTIQDNIPIASGKTLTVDVRKYLETGENRVQFVGVSEITEKKATLTFAANVTTMYLSPANFDWANPFIEGQEYILARVFIGGVLDKKLRIKVTGKNFEQEYTEPLGSTTATTIPYEYKTTIFPTAGTGIYHVEMWLDASTVESEHLHYDIMCVAAADVTTAQLVVINEKKDKVQNFSDDELFKFACYDKGATKASPSVKVTVGDIIIAEEVLADVECKKEYAYTTAVEIDSESAELTLEASMTLGNTVEVSIPIDNSASYPAKRGAIFYMNSTNRSNSQANKESIINEATGEEVAVEWNNISFSDGVDGHTVDDKGRKCLRIPATCGATINYKPFAAVTNKTVEIAFKVANVANYAEDIITIATDKGDSFVGVKVKPTNVVAFSNLAQRADTQSYNLKDEEFVHLIISLTRNYRNFGNLAKIYVNGEVRCEFEYSSSDSWAQTANIVLGSSSADLFVYKMRVYDSGCDWVDAVQNYVNCLPTLEEKNSVYQRAMAAVNDSYKVDYNYVTKAGFNTMVIEMLGGSLLPDVLHQEGGSCNLTININNIVEGELDEEFTRFFTGETLENVPIEGQGTTAMFYYRWNLRSKLTSKYNKRRITAKKNYASSMHSHKMGATRAYNELHDAIVGKNEANARVAVAQYPVYGFIKEKTDKGYAYTFAGLYTVGQDKGDDTTFGYDNEAFNDSVISLEGSDHSPLAVGFDYPWSATRFEHSVESMGAVTSSNAVAKAWEVSVAGQYSTDEAADEPGVQALLNEEFKPAYEFVYNCSPSIEGVTESLEAINADAFAWQKAHTAKEFYTDGVYDLYFFDVRTNTYQPNGINLLTQFGLSADDVASLTLEEKTALFVQKRKEYFKAHISEYWNLQDALFCYCFLLIFGATDNFKKNSYPYKFSRLADGGRWCWRQDDLDTMFDINNQGFSAKSYSILIGDRAADLESIYKGENSVFWTLLGECFAEPDRDDVSIPSVRGMVQNILSTMYAKAPSKPSSEEGVISYIRSRFWDFAQGYFPQSAYNADAEWSYEDAWGVYGKEGGYNHSLHPLQQSLGGHYEAERRWVELRVIFISSYYGFGSFAVGSTDDMLKQISFRPLSDATYTITPAIDMNPTILIGDSESVSAAQRVMAGTPVDINVRYTDSSDTTTYIRAANYIEDLGDLSQVKISNQEALSVTSKRLRRLKVGNADGNVLSNVEDLKLGTLPSLESIDARNLATLGGEVSLEGCPRIKEALFGGTNINNLAIPHGSKIEKVELPSSIKNLALVRLNNLALENLTYDNLANVTYLRVEECANINGFAMLKEAFSAEGSQLKNIRVVGFDYEGDATDLDMLATLANGSYTGIDADGRETTGLPVIEGTLHISTPVYEDSLDVVKQNYPALDIVAGNSFYIRFEDDAVRKICATNWGDGTGITEAQAAAVTNVGAVFKGNTSIRYFNEFVYFKAVKTLNDGAFTGCSSLEVITLPEEISVIPYNAFYNCTALVDVSIPDSVTTIASYAFSGCTGLNLGEFNLPNLANIGVNAFNGVNITSLKFKNLSNIEETSSGEPSTFGSKGTLAYIDFGDVLTFIPVRALVGYTVLTKVKIPDTVNLIREFSFTRSGINNIIAMGVETITGTTSTGYGAFGSCPNLSFALFGSNTSLIGQNSFRSCKKLSDFICLASTPPQLEAANVFYDSPIYNGKGFIYVPDDSVTAYREASGWSYFAAYISPISYLLLRNVELYNEVKEYLTGYVDRLIILPESKEVYSSTLKITTYYDGIEVTPEYLTEETDVATIDEDGTITFLKEGSVTVIANYNNESVRETYKYSTPSILIDKAFTPSSTSDNSYIENTNIKLFSDDYPVWTIKLSASNADYAMMGTDAALAACNDESGNPWPGFYYGRYGNTNTTRLDINPNNAEIFKTEVPQTAIIRRNNNILEYSLDGSSYTTAISDISSVLGSKPRLTQCPLIVGGYYDSSGNVGRPAYGNIRVELHFDIVDLEIE